jgi:SPP1 gp7 family putative phage head morphogenesis protein
MKRRFGWLKARIREAIVERDCFGRLEVERAGELRAALSKSGMPPKRAFAFVADPQKVDQFMDWLREQGDRGVLSIGMGPDLAPRRVGDWVLEGIVRKWSAKETLRRIRTRHPGMKVTLPEIERIRAAVQKGEAWTAPWIEDPIRAASRPAAWQNVYIDAAYKRGMRRGMEELKLLGLAPAGVAASSVEAAFVGPIHATRVAAIYSRAYDSLRGITKVMADQIRQTLALGMAEGRGMRDIARELMEEVDGIGKHRAILLSRTEIMRAHHVATIETYRAAGVLGVEVTAEWLTAGDERVCEECERMAKSEDGSPRVYTLDMIQEMIPLHPQCRCVAIPTEQSLLFPEGEGKALRGKEEEEEE